MKDVNMTTTLLITTGPIGHSAWAAKVTVAPGRDSRIYSVIMALTAMIIAWKAGYPVSKITI
jgi:hypothetical protein